MRKIVLFKFLLVFLILLSIQSCTKNESNALKIGAILPLTGDAATYGESCKQGMEIAAESFGVDIVFEDGKAQPQSSVSAIQKLINLNKVNVVIGGMFSNTTLAIKPIAINNKVLLLTPTGASEEIPDAKNHVFSIYPSAKIEGEYMAHYILKNERGNSFFVINSNEDVYKKIAQGFVSRMQASNKEVYIEEFEKNKSDYKNIISKIKKDISGIYLVGSKDDLGIIIKQMKEMNIESPIYSQSTLFDENLLNKYGDILSGVIFSAPFFSLENKDVKYLDSFVSSYKERFGNLPDVWAAYGFDAIYLIHLSSKTGNNVNEISENLLKLKDIEILTGKISFNSDGSANRAFKIFKIEDQKFKEISFD